MAQTLPKLVHVKLSEEVAANMATFFFEHGIQITDKSFFKDDGDKNRIIEIFKYAADSYSKFTMPTNLMDQSVHLVGFANYETDELEGFLLYALGTPWWSSKYKFASELAVMSLREGNGVGRAAASYMMNLVDLGLIDVVETGTAMVSNSPMANSYRKAGYIEYPSFFYFLKK